jgi:hypothetical protein
MENPSEVETPDTTTICPACSEVVAVFQMTPQGVCKFCYRRCYKNNHVWIKDPARPNEPAHIEREIGRAAKHCDTQLSGVRALEREDVTEFDFDAVCESLGEFKEDPQPLELAGVALAKLMGLAFRPGRRCANIQAGCRRLIIFAFSLNPSLFEQDSLSQLAKALRITKQSVSRYSLSLADHFNLQFRHQRNQLARQRMSQKATGHPPTNTRQKPAKAQQVAT